MINRRSILAALGFAPLAGHAVGKSASAVSPARTYSPWYAKPIVSHLGYRGPEAKHLLVQNIPGAKTFSLVDMTAPRTREALAPMFTGPLAQTGTDLGSWQIGDFSAVRQPGVYRVSVHTDVAMWDKNGFDVYSHPFTISDNLYDDLIETLVNYYRRQSCGPSPHGYNTPCHTGPIKRDDGGEARPILGGWHSAYDCQRDLPETVNGLMGLVHLARIRPDLEERIGTFAELRWGNDYFLSLQRPEGYVQFGVFGDNYFDRDKNSWDTGSFHLVTRPAPPYCQYIFAAAQPLIARIYSGSQPDYARRCGEAAARTLAWMRGRNRASWQVMDVGAGAYAASNAYALSHDPALAADAITLANRLVALQTRAGDWTEYGISSSSHSRPRDLTDYTPCVHSAYPPLGLIAAARALPDASDRSRWIDALRRYVAFVERYASLNAFGIVPARVFPGFTLPGNRPSATGSYRYFMEPNYWVSMQGSRDNVIAWATGNNAVLAGCGIALTELATLLGRPDLRTLAERQLDWFLGMNPFDSTMVVGLGRNPDATYPSELNPPVPQIDGAVFEGLIGDTEDNPLLIGGYYANVEYWTAHQAWALWLAASLSVDASA